MKYATFQSNKYHKKHLKLIEKQYVKKKNEQTEFTSHLIKISNKNIPITKTNNYHERSIPATRRPMVCVRSRVVSTIPVVLSV